VKGGLTALEVTLRTPAALDVIREMTRVEGAVVGAGTVLNPRDLENALAAGAEFIVSPGLTEPLTDAAKANGVPYLPGVATAADLMRGLDYGLDRFKFFPAEAAGGIKALKAHAAVFGAVLPDRRNHRGDGTGLAGAPVGALRRRQLGCEARCARSGGDRAGGAGGCGAAEGGVTQNQPCGLPPPPRGRERAERACLTPPATAAAAPAG
jgi:KDPG and KHG aldolase